MEDDHMPNPFPPIEVKINQKTGKVPWYLVGKGKVTTPIQCDQLPDPNEVQEFLVNSPQKVQERADLEKIPVKPEKDAAVITVGGKELRVNNIGILKGCLKTELIEIASSLSLSTDGTKDHLVEIIAKELGV